MWILHARIFDKHNVLIQIMQKHHVEIYYYPSTNYIKDKRHYFVATGLVKGNEKNKRAYFRELKKLKKAKIGRKLEFLEIEDEFFVMITSHPITKESKLYVSAAYNPKLIHANPVFVNNQGWEEWDVASLERRSIEKFIEIMENTYEIKILSFKQKKMNNFGFITMLPELTLRQKQAMKLAVDKGYYDSPRRTDLQKLAKEFHVSFSAFQGHIRKAERKIISTVLEKFKI